MPLSAVSGGSVCTMSMAFRNFMMTSSNADIFRVTGHLCEEFTGLQWIPRTKASDAEFDVFFDLRLNQRLSKQSWGWWFETLLCPLWRHCNVSTKYWLYIFGETVIDFVKKISKALIFHNSTEDHWSMWLEMKALWPTRTNPLGIWWYPVGLHGLVYRNYKAT